MTRRRQIYFVNFALQWLAKADKRATPLQKTVRLFDQSQAVEAALEWEGPVSAADEIQITHDVCARWQAMNAEALAADAKTPTHAGTIGRWQHVENLKSIRAKA